MIAKLTGTLLEKTPSRVIIETQGIGFEVLISSRTYEKLDVEKSKVSLNIHTHVREEEIRLIGFYSLQEKDIFLKLLGVSGISVKIALSSLSIYSWQELKTIISGKETDLIRRIPGIGKKLAERMLLELQDKFEDASAQYISQNQGENKNVSDTIAALKTLGYSSSEINDVMKKISLDKLEGKSTEEVLKFALKKM
jgi:holliday junction DNA helicase RuvA